MRKLFFVGAAMVACAIGCSSTSEGKPCDGPDKYEPNDTPATAKDLGDFTDDPNSKQSLDLTLPGGKDVDFFRFRVFDKGIGGDPEVTISAPEGYEITTWFTCARGKPVSTVCVTSKEVEDPDVAQGKGCQNIQPSGSVTSTTDCDADSDDDGTILVRIRRIDTSDQCASAYNVTIEVE